MNILVMGGTTFVSRSVAEHFINEGYIVDIFTRGNKAVDYSGYNRHIIGDRHNPETLDKLEAYDYVIDITAYTKADVESLTQALDLEKLKRYIFCSSGAVYESNSNLITESDPTGENPNWREYGLDKLEAENYLRENDIPHTIFRPTYIYGPHNNLYREGYFFDRMEKDLLVKYPIGNTQTQFIHIYDLCLIISSMLKNEKSLNESYNVTHEHVYTFREMLDVYEDLFGKTMNTLGVNTSLKPITRKYFPYRDVTYKLSIDKLKAHGLHVPKFDLLEGLRQTYTWYQEARPNLSDKAMTDI